ncbi:sigma-70 family RNA polymerase sigma factor [Blautia pseudococcoides]|uniref:sigma-70 family RNA polymerase sigma factor n=1 Tax=Blautia pseudococcoides TaxID=1796616 RepID=UPI00148B00F2|nr:sigma-70 family RNA polymerase sigma factor [Blautia pseudococcoides]QJU16416.1 sigma-70 family RNA polymerase sigma factor [Blautia pseudococcoides]
MELTETEKKKRYLREYRKSVSRLKRLWAELVEIKSMKASISVNNDGMPHGDGQSDLSGYVASLDGLEREIVSERYQRIMKYQEIKTCIDSLEDSRENDVLFYRYVKGLDWWKIAEKMGYTERWILKLHGKALAHLEIPEKSSL